MNILVVDDDPVFLELIAACLTGMGHTVFEADDGETAWNIYLGRTIALVISDRSMPGIDGLELCRRIRQSKRVSYPYVILVTGNGDKQSCLEGMEAGADDFIAKPLDIELLEARVRVAERIVRLQRQVEQLEALVPICGYCKQIRDEDDTWSPVEGYLHKQGARLSHGICPTCYTTHVEPQLKEFIG